MTTANNDHKPGTRGWLAQPLVATALVLAVLAAGFAAWSGWSLYRASSAGPPASAQLRDQVLQAGEQAVQNFNTLDYRKVAAGLALSRNHLIVPPQSATTASRRIEAKVPTPLAMIVPPVRGRQQSSARPTVK